MGLGAYVLLNGLTYSLVLLIKPQTRCQDRFWLFTGWSFINLSGTFRGFVN